MGPDLPGRVGFPQAMEEARRLLAEMMAGWSSKFPDVPVELRPLQGMNPSNELVEASGGTVVGFGFIIELAFLKGRDKLAGYEVESLIVY